MFQAPDTDTDPSPSAPASGGGFKAPDDDLEPPKSIEGFLGNALSNAGRAINPVNIAEGIGSSVKQGLYDIPKAAAESSVDLLQGAAKALTSGELPDKEDIENTPLLAKTQQMVAPIAKDPAGFAYKNPIDAAMLAAAPITPFLGAEGAEEAAGNVSRATIPHEQMLESAGENLPVRPGGVAEGSENMPSVSSGIHEGMAENAPTQPGAEPQNDLSQLYQRLREAGKTHEDALRDLLQSKGASASSGLSEATSGGVAMPPPPSKSPLPVIEPGAKTGEPHALFAYNDKFGPGGTERSIYNVFGDPNHPDVKAIGWGSSVPEDNLGDIPIIGRQPGSEQYTPIPKAPDLVSLPKGETGTPVSQMPPDPNAPPPPPRTPHGSAGGPNPGPGGPMPSLGPSMFESAAKTAADQASEVKDYISRGYEGYAKKPGALADIADWVQEKSQMMAAQQMGFTPNQARQLGKTPLEAHNAMRAIGQYALDKDIVSPKVGLGGMLEKNAALTKSVGKTIGDYREMADKLAGEVDPKEMVKAVRKELDQKYMRTVTNAQGEESGPRGAYGGQSGAYLKALQEIEDADHTHTGIADSVTELNHAANKAAKNQQPETPFTDVANTASRLNNERIKALIGPKNAANYEQALREFGVNKKIANGLKFKASGEVKRFGPGSTVSNSVQKGMDELGYRLGSKVANKVSTAIKNNPSVAGNLPSLFKEFINQVEDVGHDVTGMARGGLVAPDRVPDDVRKYVGC